MSLLITAASRKLNRAIEKVCDNESLPVVIGMTEGKRIAYIGWFWREVDFTQPFSLGRVRTEGSLVERLHGYHPKPVPSWAGFMENNKWDYPEWTLSAEESAVIIGLLQTATKKPTQRNLQAVFDAMQATMPDEIRDWDGSTGFDELMALERAKGGVL